MPKKSQSNSQGNIKLGVSLGERIFEALTKTEISLLLDELLAILSLYQQLTALAKLQPDTKATLTQILAPSPTVEPEKQPKPNRLP